MSEKPSPRQPENHSMSRSEIRHTEMMRALEALIADLKEELKKQRIFPQTELHSRLYVDHNSAIFQNYSGLEMYSRNNDEPILKQFFASVRRDREQDSVDMRCLLISQNLLE